jgi:hypothetical protein
MVYLLFWTTFGWVLAFRRDAMLPLLICSMSFGAATVLPTAATGGITILPRMVCAIGLVATILLRTDGGRRAWTAMTSPRQLGLLSTFMLLAVFVSILMPRLFLGSVTIVGLNTAQLQLLRPSANTYSQLFNLLLSYCVTVTTALLVATPEGRRSMVKALVAGAFCAIATGLLDLATHGTGYLDFLRNANYLIRADSEILGSSRIVGFMPEASAFGGLCVALGTANYFLGRTLASDRPWRIASRVAALLLLAMAALSTSSTALLGLGMFALVATADWVVRAARSTDAADRRAIFVEFAVGSLILLTIGTVLLLDSGLFRPAATMIDTMLFQKTQSASYVERSMWNEVSFRAMIDTYGLGVGIGSTRTSSWVVALVSCTGVAGAALMAAFLLRFLCASLPDNAERGAREMLYGVKLCWMVSFVTGAVATPSADFGLYNGILFGIMAGVRFAFLPQTPRLPLPRRDSRRPFERTQPRPGRIAT